MRARAELELHGVRTTAIVSNLSDYGGKGSDYHVAVAFTDRNGKAIKASTIKLVTKSDYEKLRVGTPVEIFYKPQDPQDFRLALSLQRLGNDKSLFIAFSVLSSIGLMMVLDRSGKSVDEKEAKCYSEGGK